jgi:hypothetical protein
MNAINQEINKILNSMRLLNETIFLLKNKKKNICNNSDMNILEDELISTELQLELETQKYNDLMQTRDYQNYCNHSFVEDLVDITPDKSKIINYCVHCFLSYEN